LTRFGLTAEARGQIGDRTDCTVIPPALETDAADGGIALRDANTEIQLITELPPLSRQLRYTIAHRQRHPNRPLCRVSHRHRIIKKYHHAVAGESFQSPCVF